MNTIWQDIRFGIRMLMKNPGFTMIAVLILGLGIGVNTAIFQLVDVVRLRTLPVENPHEIVGIEDDGEKWGHYEGPYPRTSNPVWEEIRENQQAFSGIFAWSKTDFNLAQGGETRFANGLWVSGDYFNVLGVRPVLGRVFTNADDQRGSSPAAVISYSFWQREYDGDPSIIGKTLSLNDVQTEIIGVSAPGFFGLEIGSSYDVAIPVSLHDLIRKPARKWLDDGSAWWLVVMGRLKPGWTFEQASSSLKAISSGIFQNTLPPNYPKDGIDGYLNHQLVAYSAVGGVSNLREDYTNPLWLLMGLAGLVMLIACANLANLMLARANTREQETAVRLAIGATRIRLIQQLLTESVLLSFAGACLGFLLSQYFVQILISMLSAQAGNLFLDIQTNWRIIAFTTGVAVLTCLLFGLIPAIQSSKMSPASSLKSGGRSMTSSRQKVGIRRVLVVSQIALSLMLLVSAFLFSGSLQNLLTEDTGFNQDNILISKLDISGLNLPQERIPLFKQTIIENLEAIPGVKSAVETSIIPLSGNRWADNVWLDGEDTSELFNSHFNEVDVNFFKTLETPLLYGREFDLRGTESSANVAIVSEEFAKHFGEGSNPVGKRFFMRDGNDNPKKSYEIIGVVKNTKYNTLQEEYRAIAFFPRDRSTSVNPDIKLLIKGSIPVSLLTSSVKHTLTEIDPNIQYEFESFETQIQNTLIREKLLATLSGFFGFLAVLLAACGLYGVISFMVINRKNEIGIRMAVGANQRMILVMVIREAIILLIIGLAVGTFLSYLIGKTINSLLFGLTAMDVTTFIFAVSLLTIVVVLAGYIPARRAAKVDPMTALRCD